MKAGASAWNCVPDRQHTAFETDSLFWRDVFPRIERLVPADAKVLLRQDSGSMGRICCSCRPKRKDTLDSDRARSFRLHHQMETRASRTRMPAVRKADAAGASWRLVPGKRVGLLSLKRRTCLAKQKRHFRLVVPGSPMHHRQEGAASVGAGDRAARLVDQPRDVPGKMSLICISITGTHEQFHSGRSRPIWIWSAARASSTPMMRSCIQ